MAQFQYLNDYVALSYCSDKETYTVKVFTSTIACLSGKHCASALFIRDSGNTILFRREFEFVSYNDLKNRVECMLDHYFNYPQD